jgi:sugar lactone lactonase YvrE
MAGVLTKRKKYQFLVFERKVLRTICGPKIENNVYRRRYNHELDKEFNSPNDLNVTKTSRLLYAGHMIRRPEDLPQKALFRAKPNGRRNQGRPKSRWANGVNSNSLALGVRD